MILEGTRAEKRGDSKGWLQSRDSTLLKEAASIGRLGEQSLREILKDSRRLGGL